jgi:hypothetical protein
VNNGRKIYGRHLAEMPKIREFLDLLMYRRAESRDIPPIPLLFQCISISIVDGERVKQRERIASKSEWHLNEENQSGKHSARGRRFGIRRRVDRMGRRAGKEKRLNKFSDSDLVSRGKQVADIELMFSIKRAKWNCVA